MLRNSLLDVRERLGCRGRTRKESNDETGVESEREGERSIEGVGLRSESSSTERLGVCRNEGGEEGRKEGR